MSLRIPRAFRCSWKAIRCDQTLSFDVMSPKLSPRSHALQRRVTCVRCVFTSVLRRETAFRAIGVKIFFIVFAFSSPQPVPPPHDSRYDYPTFMTDIDFAAFCPRLAISVVRVQDGLVTGLEVGVSQQPDEGLRAQLVALFAHQQLRALRRLSLVASL